MGLGFSPLPYRLQPNSRAPSAVQPESNTIVAASFSLIQTVTASWKQQRRQQQSVLVLLRQPRVETMQTVSGNSRERTRAGGHKPQPAKSGCGRRSTMLARML